MTSAAFSEHAPPMFTFGSLGETHNTYVGVDPLILMVLAILIDAYVGDATYVTRYVKHPVVWMGEIIGVLDQKLNRDKRSNLVRLVRGILVVIFIITLVGIFSIGVAWLTRVHPWGWVVEFVFVISLLAGRGLYNHVLLVARGLEKNVEAGREAVSHIVGRNPAELDEHGVARASIESLAENFADGVVAPVFWYLLFGFPGMVIYKAVNTMDSMVGYKNDRYRYFGAAAALLDDVLNFIPARISGFLITIAAVFAPHAKPKEALRVMIRDATKHRSPNSGWAEAPMAGALGVALSGPRKYDDHVVDDPWIGWGRARVTTADIHRALYLYIVANLVHFTFIAALLMVRIGMLN